MHCISKLNAVDSIFSRCINFLKTKDSVCDVVANTNVLRVLTFKLNLNSGLANGLILQLDIQKIFLNVEAREKI